MITKKIRCSRCNYEKKITGKYGEQIILTCPNCNTKGSFNFQEKLNNNINTAESFAIEVNSLTKSFNGLKAVNNISFNVREGEIFGFLGPNGAGKTTTIKAMLGLIRVNSGEIKINEKDIKNDGKEAKKFVGYLPEKVAFYNNLTALQNLHFYAEMKNASKDNCKGLIEEFGLGDTDNKKVGTFSKGMVQRLGMARAVLNNPSILILDEPSGGLDPRGVVLIREKIKEMKKKGTTIFISSHILSEIQEVCDRVGIINKGRIVAIDTVSHLSKKLNIKPRITIELDNASDVIIKTLKKIKGVDKIERIGRSIDVICDSKTKAKVILEISKVGGNIINVYTRDPSLEDVFMRLTEERK